MGKLPYMCIHKDLNFEKRVQTRKCQISLRKSSRFISLPTFFTFNIGIGFKIPIASVESLISSNFHSFLISLLHHDRAILLLRLLPVRYLQPRRVPTQTGVLASTVQIPWPNFASYDKFLPVLRSVDGKRRTLVPQPPSKIRYFACPCQIMPEIDPIPLTQNEHFLLKALL